MIHISFFLEKYDLYNNVQIMHIPYKENNVTSLTLINPNFNYGYIYFTHLINACI